MLKGRDATASSHRQALALSLARPPSPAPSVGSAPLPPLPEQQEKLGRISGSKLDPGPEDEETLVTSLPTPRGPKITFLCEKPSGTPPGRARRRGAKYCTQTRLSCTVRGALLAEPAAVGRRIHSVARGAEKQLLLFASFSW